VPRRHDIAVRPNRRRRPRHTNITAAPRERTTHAARQYAENKRSRRGRSVSAAAIAPVVVTPFHPRRRARRRFRRGRTPPRRETYATRNGPDNDDGPTSQHHRAALCRRRGRCHRPSSSTCRRTCCYARHAPQETGCRRGHVNCCVSCGSWHCDPGNSSRSSSSLRSSPRSQVKILC
jgi:hypothetical protein